jgi:hypothetical protein
MFSAECTYNKIYVIQSLPKGQLQTGLRLAQDDLNTLCGQFDMGLEFIEIQNEFQLSAFINETINECLDKQKPIFPIFHFEMHGNEHGIQLSSGEVINWQRFNSYCKMINIACKNNLAVIMAVCKGFYAINKIKIKDSTPYYLLIGPQTKVYSGFIHANMPAFYKELITSMNMKTAIQRLQPHYVQYLCERVFVRAFIGYIKQYCKGKGKQRRIEKLISQYRMIHDGDIENIKEVRKAFKSLVIPNEENFYRFKNSFLLADLPENKDRFNFSLEDILELLNKSKS